MAYKVKIENSDVNFYFVDIDDALNFASMVTEHGSVEDYHYDRDENGKNIRVSDGWRPAEVTFSKAGEVGNE